MANPLDEIKKLWTELRASQQHQREISERIKSLEGAVQRVSHHHVIPRTGIDYSFSRPPIDKLHSAGVSFVGRYLTGVGKALDFGEAHELSHWGIDIFAIFEQAGGRAAEGYNAGVQDAITAKHALDALHPKGEPPVYFACDFDAHGEGKTNDVLEYIRGAVHTIGWYRVGLYAGYDVVLAAANEHRCKFLWQTLAWSGGKWLPEAQLRQTGSGNLFGADVDWNKAIAADFGQFKV